jgi:putative NADH-flavin reductase
MLNAETPRLKFALFGAHSSLGNALLCELLTRQHEVVAVVDDLNSMTARPGLRSKPGDLFDARSVAQGVAGMDAVLCLLDSPELPGGSAPAEDSLYRAVETLLVGLPQAGVTRLLLIGDFPTLARGAQGEAALQRLAAHPLRWTLVEAAASGRDLSIDDFAQMADAEPGSRLYRLRHIAAGIVDELEHPQHLHQQIRFREPPAAD